MPVKFDAQEFATALRQIKQVRPNAQVSHVSNGPLGADEWQQTEEFKLRVISARTKLKLMRDRSDALQDSLQRFRAQQRTVVSA